MLVKFALATGWLHSPGPGWGSRDLLLLQRSALRAVQTRCKKSGSWLTGAKTRVRVRIVGVAVRIGLG